MSSARTIELRAGRPHASAGRISSSMHSRTPASPFMRKTDIATTHCKHPNGSRRGFRSYSMNGHTMNGKSGHLSACVVCAPGYLGGCGRQSASRRIAPSPIPSPSGSRRRACSGFPRKSWSAELSKRPLRRQVLDSWYPQSDSRRPSTKGDFVERPENCCGSLIRGLPIRVEAAIAGAECAGPCSKRERLQRPRARKSSNKRGRISRRLKTSSAAMKTLYEKKVSANDFKKYEDDIRKRSAAAPGWRSLESPSASVDRTWLRD